MKNVLMSMVLAAAAAGTSLAIQVGPPPIHQYEITLPTFSGGVENDAVTFEYVFRWIGPLQFNAPPNSLPPDCCGALGAPKPGYFDAGTIFTSSGIDPEVIFQFSDFSGIDFAHSNTLSFTIIEPDSFWAQSGSHAFDGGAANYAIGGSDPSCVGCSYNEETLTPEPGTPLLVVTAVTGLGLLRRRRRA